MDEQPGHETNTSAQTILIVDDEPTNLSLLNALLQPHFRVRVARTGADALRAVAMEPRPDLVLLDVMMPEMDGYTVLSKLRESPDFRNLPVIFVTAMDAHESEKIGLALGAVDYITKPISPVIVLARVRTQLELKAARDRLADQNVQLEGLVAERTKALKLALNTAKAEHAALKASYFGTLMAIGGLAELRGESIGGHSRRVADMASQVAQKTGLSVSEIQDVFVAGLLHDIGKIGFPDELLRKPVNTMKGEDLALYRRHPMLGANALEKIDALAHIAAVLRSHHEHFDGSGFPEGKSGLEIPLGARIIIAASDYDDLRGGALTASPMSSKEVHRYLIKGRGHRYDPAVIDCLMPLLSVDLGDEVEEIRVSAGHLQEDMMLSRDVMHPDGFLLLSKSTVLVRRVIDQIVTIEKESGRSVEIFVLRKRVKR